MERLGMLPLGLRYILGEGNLKSYLFYFDRLLYDANEIESAEYLGQIPGERKFGVAGFKEQVYRKRKELDFLEKENLISKIDLSTLHRRASEKDLKLLAKCFEKKSDEPSFFEKITTVCTVDDIADILFEHNRRILGDTGNRNLKNNILTLALSMASDMDVVPILNQFTSDNILYPSKSYKVIEIVLNKFPIIGEDVSLQQIRDFREDQEIKRKFLALRNWMIDISKANLTGSEITEKLDHLYEEYYSYLRKHKLKTRFGSFKNIIITTSEILEDLIKIQWSKAIRTGFEIIEGNTKLADVEANAPGKEVAYIYNIREEFKSTII